MAMGRWIALALALAYAALMQPMASCRKEIDGFDRFIVKAGHHECNGWRYHPYTRSSLDFEIQTNISWLFHDRVPSGNNGISKITGFAESMDHQKNRIVLGYKYHNDGSMWLWAYGNVDGVPFEEAIYKISSNTIYFCRISIEDGYYVIRIDDTEWMHKCNEKACVGARLNPYVGGEFVLQHDWNVLIKWHK